MLENIASCQKQRVNFEFEIIVAVNAPTDAERKKLAPLAANEKVQLIFNETNLGYPRGVNAAVRKSSGEIIFIVNPDIVWRDRNALAKLVHFLDTNPHVGIVGPRQIDEPTGETALTVRAFPKLTRQIARRTWLRRLPIIRSKVAFDEMRHLDHTKIQPVDWLQSSCIAVRRELWEAVGGLDERFFLFMSDPDLCWKAWQRGYEVIYFPDTVVGADGRRCSAGGFFDFFRKWTLRQHLRDALKYHARYFGRRNPRLK